MKKKLKERRLNLATCFVLFVGLFLICSRGAGFDGEKPAFSAVVALEYSRERVLCSGVVLTDQQLITAAHCLCRELPIYAFVGSSVHHLSESNNSDAGLQMRLDINLERIEFMSTEFCKIFESNPRAAMMHGDLALLFFQKPLSSDIWSTLSDFSHRSDDVKLERYLVSGWGESDNFWRPGKKMFSEVKMTSPICTDEDQSKVGCAAGRESIAADPPRDTCYADSGGGLFGQDSKGMLYLIGITSRGLIASTNKMCGMGGIYSSLQSEPIRKWLSDALIKTYIK